LTFTGDAGAALYALERYVPRTHLRNSRRSRFVPSHTREDQPCRAAGNGGRPGDEPFGERELSLLPSAQGWRGTPRLLCRIKPQRMGSKISSPSRGRLVALPSARPLSGSSAEKDAAQAGTGGPRRRNGFVEPFRMAMWFPEEPTRARARCPFPERQGEPKSRAWLPLPFPGNGPGG